MRLLLCCQAPALAAGQMVMAPTMMYQPVGTEVMAAHLTYQPVVTDFAYQPVGTEVMAAPPPYQVAEFAAPAYQQVAAPHVALDTSFAQLATQVAPQVAVEAHPPSFAQLAAQQLPPRWRPPQPKVPFTTDPQVVEKEKAKYVEQILREFERMKAEGDDEIKAMERQANMKKTAISTQVKEQMEYKEEQLIGEFHRSLDALERQREAQAAELERKTQQMIADKLAPFDLEVEQRRLRLESDQARQVKIVEEARAVQERRWDDAAKLLVQFEADLEEQKRDFNWKAREMLEGAKDKVRRQIGDRGVFID